MGGILASQIKSLFLTFVLLTLNGCGSTLVVRTEPSDAKVSISPLGSLEPKEIGKSPVEVTDKAIMEVIKIDPNSGTYYEIVIEKDGYDTERLIVPAARFMPMTTYVDVKMKSGSSETRLASQLVQLLMNAQKFAAKNEFERAHIEADKALAIDSNFPRAHTLKGSIFFLQQRYKESLASYEKALELDSKLEDAVRMISELKKKIGAGVGP